MSRPSHRDPSAFGLRRPQRRKMQLESLESRRVRAALPFGAMSNDTGELLLGRVAVTPVLLESNGQVDRNVENWNPAHIDEVLANFDEGLNWWTQLLATKSQVHNLEFVVDRRYADQPTPTAYEPINRPSNDYSLWTQEFLTRIGYSQTSILEDNVRAFNNAQRSKYDADWAFTVFVVNSQVDGDGTFASGGSFNRAFAFAGGLFFVIPSTRPASTYTHETGHIFWARDEYAGGGSYFLRRGYYGTQNLNAIDGNPESNFQQAPSIMSSGTSLTTAYDQLISPPSTLAMLGWQDSDNDGIFDALDVPLVLDGVGRVDVGSDHYRFIGQAHVQTLPNRNTSGLVNDITLNKISRVEYRFDDGPWQTIAQPNIAVAAIDVSIPLAGQQSGTIQVRAIDAQTRITSNIFTGSIGALPDATANLGITGFAWTDANANGLFDATESALAGQAVRLVDNSGQLLSLQRSIEPDAQVPGLIPSTAYPGVKLFATGTDSNGNLGVFSDASATTGSKVFRPYSISFSGYADNWNDRRQLKIEFASPTSFVAVDVINSGFRSFGRLELYDANDNLLSRATSGQLVNGQSQRLELGRDTADIAYAIVRGHMSTGVKIDNLQYGPKSQLTTDNTGRYWFANLPDGTYNVQIVLPGVTSQVTSAAGQRQSVSLQTREAEQHVDFGINFENTAWHNIKLAEDVNDDGAITAIDVLLIVNLLNQGTHSALIGSNLPFKPYIDVSNDAFVSPIDALLVINALNTGRGSGEGDRLRGNGGSMLGGITGGGIGGNFGTGDKPEGELSTLSGPVVGGYANRYSEPAGPVLPTDWQSNCLFNQLAIDHQRSEGEQTAWGNFAAGALPLSNPVDWAMSDEELMASLHANPWTLPLPCCCAECQSLTS